MPAKQTHRRQPAVLIEPAGQGHTITLNGAGRPVREVIISDEELKRLFLGLLDYPRIRRCFDEALRRCVRKLELARAMKAAGGRVRK
jgi:hypothetical protein